MDCPHDVVKVIEWNALGAAVSCISCRAGWQMSSYRISANWHRFESREFPGRDEQGRYKDPTVILVRNPALRR